jgi:hypothetical protein
VGRGQSSVIVSKIAETAAGGGGGGENDKCGCFIASLLQFLLSHGIWVHMDFFLLILPTDCSFFFTLFLNMTLGQVPDALHTLEQQ